MRQQPFYTARIALAIKGRSTDTRLLPMQMHLCPARVIWLAAMTGKALSQLSSSGANCAKWWWKGGQSRLLECSAGGQAARSRLQHRHSLALRGIVPARPLAAPRSLDGSCGCVAATEVSHAVARDEPAAVRLQQQHRRTRLHPGRNSGLQRSVKVCTRSPSLHTALCLQNWALQQKSLETIRQFTDVR